MKKEAAADRISVGTRIAYGCGDTACNIVYGMISSLLTLFYTDYAGISPITVGIVMLVSRVFDGSSDLIMGFIVDRTKSRWGKSRPWLLWMMVPYGIAAVLALNHDDQRFLPAGYALCFPDDVITGGKDHLGDSDHAVG